MSYIYVFNAGDHIKLGKTKNPSVRTTQHSRELGREISLSALWKCSDIDSVEETAKFLLRSEKQKTKERFLVSESKVMDAVVRAAETCGAEMERIDDSKLPRAMTRKPNSQYVRYEIRLERHFSDKFEAWVAKNRPGVPKATIIREALEHMMKNHPIK